MLDIHVLNAGDVNLILVIVTNSSDICEHDVCT